MSEMERPTLEDMRRREQRSRPTPRQVVRASQGGYRVIADAVRESAWVKPVWITTLIAYGASWVLYVRDYLSSVYGYALVPYPDPLGGFSSLVVALLPQLVQQLCWYLFIGIWLNPRIDRKWAYYALATGLTFLAFDVGLDTAYQVLENDLPMSVPLVVGALAQSVLIFSGGSEVLNTVTVGIVIELWPDVRPDWLPGWMP